MTPYTAFNNINTRPETEYCAQHRRYALFLVHLEPALAANGQFAGRTICGQLISTQRHPGGFLVEVQRAAGALVIQQHVLFAVALRRRRGVTS